MADSKQRCTHKTKLGRPCSNVALRGELYCFAHAGHLDMRELGRKGGLKSGQVRRGISPELVDDDLRERARSRLHGLLDSDDEKTQLSAAKSLFSYGATPPSDGRPTGGPPASIQYDFKAIRRELEKIGVYAYRPGSPAESERLVELRAQVETLRDENAKLRERVAELEGRSG